ncbi:MAG: hypothetical protein IJU90_00295 [Bacteroidales bacterium]|nr:hypothetical protein [Bacteroidales bacterium]
METNIEKKVKEADLHLQIQIIESNCKTICRLTDGTVELGESAIETIQEINSKTLEAVKNYYKIKEEIKHME